MAYLVMADIVIARKVLIFWLVHPDIRVPSTKDVAAQQYDAIIKPVVEEVLTRRPDDFVPI